MWQEDQIDFCLLSAKTSRSAFDLGQMEPSSEADIVLDQTLQWQNLVVFH